MSNYYNGIPGTYLPKDKNVVEDTVQPDEAPLLSLDLSNFLKVAKFEKVPYEQFEKDIMSNNCLDNPEQSTIKELYDAIKLPKRGTPDSAGYDFHSPISFRLKKGKSIVIPTGIRCQIKKFWWLMALPRSGSGFKYKVQLYNTVGVIDGDYYNADNYGHIMIKLTSEHDCKFNQGDGFCQGIFTLYGITTDDEVSGKRTGGLGSTDVVKNQ